MPWYEKSMKDATTCDKPRIGGNNLRPVDFRIGQPISSNVEISAVEYIGCGRQPGELKHLSTRRKRKQ